MKSRLIIFFCGFLTPTFASGNEIGALGAPICGYGKYRVGNECYEYGTQSNVLCDGASVTGAACLAVFVESSGEFANLSPFSGGFADIGAPTDTESPADTVCGGAGVSGAACLSAFVESSGEFANLSPFSGGFTDIGAPSDTFTKMREKDCLGTMDGFYETGIDWYSSMKNAACPSGTTNYVIPNDCQYIDTSSTDTTDVHSGAFPENWLCGVLCDTGLHYSGTGACSAFCETDDKVRRFYVRGGKYDFSVPLYVDKLTTPAVNLSIYEKSTGQRKMCYMNLLPHKGEQNMVVKHKETVLYSSK